MFGKVLWWKHLIFLCASLGMGFTILFAAMPLNVYAQARAHARFSVKVLIITMFPPERDKWMSYGLWKEVSKPIGSIGPTPGDKNAYGVVYCQTKILNGVYEKVVGRGRQREKKGVSSSVKHGESHGAAHKKQTERGPQNGNE
jgi:purine nucleoside permease